MMIAGLYFNASIQVAALYREWVCSRVITGSAGSNPAGAWVFVSSES
jgi:hypothetical protein